jgi:acetyltransferase-like isoleucine patch superfamily enzyme
MDSSDSLNAYTPVCGRQLGGYLLDQLAPFAIGLAWIGALPPVPETPGAFESFPDLASARDWVKQQARPDTTVVIMPSSWQPSAAVVEFLSSAATPRRAGQGHSQAFGAPADWILGQDTWELDALLSQCAGECEHIEMAPDQVLRVEDAGALGDFEQIVRQRNRQKWLEAGIRMMDPASTFIDSQVEIGSETVLYPGVLLEGRTVIGERCTVQSNAHISHATIEDEVTIAQGSVVTDSIIRTASWVGPYAHVRLRAQIGPRARVGNFVEIKNSHLGDGTKAAHLRYLGDAQIGDGVNIGAGTITCNYDGVHKHITVIDDGAFIGSNSQLVAPVRVGAGAYVAAGSTVTRDVPATALAIGRSRQIIKKDWKSQQARKRDKPESD